ncbi:MAG: hypothetical protein HGA67_03285 [Candidatus Yonathbacteria bacterium]|nr:hypothetical protein [Candidatus Yonathbacteria bacterium]
MKKIHYWNSVIVLAFAGTLFAGYLTLTKLITGTCAFSEPCPYFLGYPACWYGLAMFVFMFIASLRGRFSKKPTQCRIVMRAVSIMGTLFAGYFVLQEVPALWGVVPATYGMGLPTCAYGLVFYIAILVLSFMAHEDGVLPPSSVNP